MRNINELAVRLDEMAYEVGVKQRPDLTAEAAKKAKAYSEAFWTNMHTGEITNVLREGSDGSGGYLVPDEFDAHLVEALRDRNIFRQLGRVMPTSHDLKIPTAVAHTTAQWVDENHTYEESDSEFGQTSLSAHKVGMKVLVSDELMEERAIDLEPYLVKNFGEAIGDTEEEAFAIGDGVGKPLSIIHQAETGVTAESVSSLLFDDVVDLYHSLKSPYREKAVWVMSEDADIALHKIKTAYGRNIWPTVKPDGKPDELLGRPIYICRHLNGIFGGNVPILFGDFNYYWIGDRGKCILKRLNERYADVGQVGFLASERVDARLVLPETVKALKVNHVGF